MVLIRPTFVRRDIFASSMANAGVSTILSLRTLEHLLELYRAETYRSEKGTLVDTPGTGLVKTAFLSENM